MAIQLEIDKTRACLKQAMPPIVVICPCNADTLYDYSLTIH